MLTENDVVEAVVGHLEDHGWTIIQTATTHQRGPDILARKDDHDLVVEAKGGTSSKPTPREGKPFSSSQTFSHVAKAFYTAGRLFSEGRCRPAIALPATDRHRQLVEAIRPALESLGVGVFLVDEDRIVHEVLDGESTMSQTGSGVVATRIKDTASTARSGARRLASAGAQAVEKGGDRVRSTASGLAVGAIETVKSLPDYARNLDWNTLDPTPYLYAGTRGISRGTEEARLVWESIPEHLRALGPDAVKARLDGFDWSHIIPHSQGGGSEAANGIFELAGLNRSRGAVPMTPDDIAAAESVLSAQAFQAALEEVASRVVTGAACGAAISLVIAILEHSLAQQRGEISQDEMYRRIGRDVAKSTTVAATIPAIVTHLVLNFPILIPIAMPLLVLLAAAGLCVVGGKVYRLGKGWYELRQDKICGRGREGSVSA